MITGTFDFETDPFKHGRNIQPFASCIYFDEDNNAVIFDEKKCAEETAATLLDLPKCELYAHNGGKFDVQFLLPYAEEQNIKIINGRIAKMQIGNATLIDSLLLMPFSLDKYKKTKISYKLFEKALRWKNKDEIVKYLISDCRNLLELLKRFHEELSKKLTIGSAAIHSIKKLGIEYDKQNKKHDDDFRPFYHGGRVDVFKNGHFKFKKNKHAHVVDINAAYSYAMTFDHPTGAKYKNSKKIPSGDSGAWFADIEAVSKGALPFKNKYDLEFPNDDVVRNFKVTGWEILAGLETSTLDIKKINKILIPKKTINFTPFVMFHYNMRLSAKAANDKAGDLLHKFAGNSGYGKFATNPEKFYDWVLVEKGVDVKKVYKDAVNYRWYSDLGDKSFWRCPATEEQKAESYFDVATAASITGFQRARLWRGIMAVDTPYYCDTDGIICDGPGNLVLSQKDLGDWKTEMRPQEMYIIAKKIYALKEGKNIKVVCKGARFKFGDIKKLYDMGVIHWKNSAPTYSIKNGRYYIDRIIKKY